MPPATPRNARVAFQPSSPEQARFARRDKTSSVYDQFARNQTQRGSDQSVPANAPGTLVTMVLAGVKIVSALMCGGISVLLFGAPARFALGVEAVLALAEAKGVDMLINTRQPAVAGAIRGAHGLPGGNGPLNDTEKRRVMPALSGLAGFVSTVVAVTANMLKARDMRHKGQPALPDLSQLARQAESSTLKKMLYQARLLGRRLEESALQRMLHRHALIPPVLGILLGTAIGYAEGKIADGVLRHSEKRPR